MGTSPTPPAPTPVQMTDIQTLPFTVSGVDADGNPTGAVAGVTFAVSPSTGGSVAPVAGDTTGTQFAFTPNPAAGNLGAVQIQASAPNPANPSVQLTGQLNVNVVASATNSISIVPGTPA
jgi:hypothetical protein